MAATSLCTNNWVSKSKLYKIKQKRHAWIDVFEAWFWRLAKDENHEMARVEFSFISIDNIDNLCIYEVSKSRFLLFFIGFNNVWWTLEIELWEGHRTCQFSWFSGFQNIAKTIGESNNFMFFIGFNNVWWTLESELWEGHQTCQF